MSGGPVIVNTPESSGSGSSNTAIVAIVVLVIVVILLWWFVLGPGSAPSHTDVNITLPTLPPNPVSS